MAYLPCDKCGQITTQQGSWDTPIKILCVKCSKNYVQDCLLQDSCKSFKTERCTIKCKLYT